MGSQRRKRRPLGSYWGEFGRDDQLGRLPPITPDKVRQGREGGFVGLEPFPVRTREARIRRHPPIDEAANTQASKSVTFRASKESKSAG